jgi:beta-barrel assembly-enhancing protease
VRFPHFVLLLIGSLYISGVWASDISETREIEIGDELAISLLQGGKLHNNERAQEYVNQVGRWIANQTERAELPWQFGIIDRAETGAYALPGGKVLLTQGMLLRLKNEAELAGVLAHEIAHIVRRHQLKNWPTQTEASGLGGITQALDAADELEADRMAIVLMARAGYDPKAYVNVLRNLQTDRTNDPGLQLLASIHPPWKDRIAAVQAALSQIKEIVRFEDESKTRSRYSTVIASLRKNSKK